MIKRLLDKQEYDGEFLEHLTTTITYLFFNGIKKQKNEKE